MTDRPRRTRACHQRLRAGASAGVRGIEPASSPLVRLAGGLIAASGVGAITPMDAQARGRDVSERHSRSYCGDEPTLVECVKRVAVDPLELEEIAADPR